MFTVSKISLEEVKAILESNHAIEIDCLSIDLDELLDRDVVYLAYATNSVTNSGSVGMYCVAKKEHDALYSVKEMLHDHDVKTGDMENHYEKEAPEYDMDTYDFWCESVNWSIYKIGKESVEYLIDYNSKRSDK
jgi:hypothetical protein